MKKLSLLFAMLAIVASSVYAQTKSKATTKKNFKVAWSIYVGWNPWQYAKESGILKKYADKNGITIELVKMDYVPSMEAYVAKQVDACVMTNMDCLTMPISSGVATTAIILGDFSNGNDGICVRDNLTLADLKGKDIALVQYTVSHYMLSRALDIEKTGLKDEDVNIINTSDSDIGSTFISNKSQKAVVTWNPILMDVMKTPGVTKIFDSSKIPGEILDMMMVNTAVLEANPALGKALAGAWYEVMGIMSVRTGAADQAMQKMADAGGSSLVEYKNQLKTTAMFYKATDAVNYMKGEEIQTNMKRVRNFCFKYKLLGERVTSADDIGISFPGGAILGNKTNVLFKFDNAFMQLAVDGKL